MVPSFLIGEAIGFGWKAAKARFWFLAGVVFFGIVALYIPAIILGVSAGSLARAAGAQVLSPSAILTANLITTLIQLVVSMGFITISLRLVDGKRAAFRDFFSSLPRFLPFLGATILQSVIVLAGMILLIIPGIIWGIKYQFTPYFVVDRGLGPTDALKASGIATAGVKGRLFLFGIALAALNIAGALLLGIGLFITIPVSILALAHTYRILAARVPEMPIRSRL